MENEPKGWIRIGYNWCQVFGLCDVAEEPWQIFLDLLSLPKDPPLHCLSKHNSTYTSVERALSPLVCSHLFIMDKGSWQILIVCIK